MKKLHRNDRHYCISGRMAQKLGWAYIMPSYRRDFIKSRRIANHL